jgi:Flp pilus assembly protein TadD
LALDVLMRAVEQAPGDPAARLACVLALVYAGQCAETPNAFRSAAEFAPDEPCYRHINGAGPKSDAGTTQAIDELRNALERFQGYREITFALATINRDAGNTSEALRYARQLLELSPENAAALALTSKLDRPR